MQVNNAGILGAVIKDTDSFTSLLLKRGASIFSFFGLWEELGVNSYDEHALYKYNTLKLDY